MSINEALNIFEKIVFFMEIKGENIFTNNAFTNAIRDLRKLQKKLLPECIKLN